MTSTQVLATAWLLGLIGFRVIPLGIFYNNEYILDENQSKTLHSADILAEDSEFLLLLPLHIICCIVFHSDDFDP